MSRVITGVRPSVARLLGIRLAYRPDTWHRSPEAQRGAQLSYREWSLSHPTSTGIALTHDGKLPSDASSFSGIRCMWPYHPPNARSRDSEFKISLTEKLTRQKCADLPQRVQEYPCGFAEAVGILRVCALSLADRIQSELVMRMGLIHVH